MAGASEVASLVCDGRQTCARGAFVRVSPEYVDWDVFRKFKGKVGVLTWRHFSGMWYADFPGEDEYGFLCGPLLFQLQHSSEKEARESIAALEQQRKEKELQNEIEMEKSKQLVQALEKRAKEMSATTAKLFEQMTIIQEEMRKAECDINKMEQAFTNLTEHANALDAELGSARDELGEAMSNNAQLQAHLKEYEANAERMAARVKTLTDEVKKWQADMADVDRHNAALSKEVQEKQERLESLELENGALNSKVAAMESDLAECKSQLATMEENFLSARREADRKPAEAEASGPSIEFAGTHDGGQDGSSKAERDSLLDQLLRCQKDLEHMTKLRDEAQKKFDDVMNDEGLFMRLASARHGSVGSGAGRDLGGNTMMMSDDELHQLQLDADRASQAERELDELQKKMKEMAEDAKNGKKVPGLLKDIEKLNEKIEQQKTNGERHKQDQARLNTELRNVRQSLKVMTAEKEQVENDLSTKTHDCNLLQRERDTLKDRIRDFQQKLDDMTDAMAAQSARSDSCKAEVDKLSAANAELVAHVSEQAQTIDGLEQAGDALRKEIASLTHRKSELEKHLKVARGKVKEVELREANFQSEVDLKMRKAEARIQDLQDQLKDLGALKGELMEQVHQLSADAGAAHARIEELLAANMELTDKLANEVKNANAERRIVNLYFHKIQHQVSVPPRKVFFKIWRLHTVATKHWNADDTKKAQEAAVRKSKHEANSLRLRLGAAQRLVEEMQRRDKSIALATHLVAPPTSRADAGEEWAAVDEPDVCGVVGVSTRGTQVNSESEASQGGGAEKASKGKQQGNESEHGKAQRSAHGGDGGIVQELGAKHDEHAADTSEPAKTADCPRCIIHAVQFEGVSQRNTRLQREALLGQQRLQASEERNDSLNAQIAELKKSLNLLGCLRHAGKLVPAVKDRKVALEARSLSQALTVSLLDRERGLHMSTGASAHASVTLSPIVARKAELEAEAIQHGTTLEQQAEAVRSNRYKDIVELAESTGPERLSIFEQLDLLTGNLGELTTRHDGVHMRRQRKMQQAIMDNQGQQKNPLKSSSSVLALPPAQRAHPRPQTAH